MESSDSSSSASDDDQGANANVGLGQPRGRGRGRAAGRPRGRGPRGRAPNRPRGAGTTDQAYGWVENDDDFVDPPDYTQQQTVHVPQQDPLSVMDAFQLIFDIDFFKSIKAETNKYARQNQTEAQRAAWSIVTLDEIRQFFAIMLHMSLVQKPAMRDYFSHDPVLYNTFTKHVGMSRDRFLSIMKYLHVNDNAGFIPRDQPNHDPLHKVRPMVDLLNRRFKELYTPSANLTIDEAMIPFRGRLSFKVYMKNKPNKYGVRLEVVADADNGVVCFFETYSGGAGAESNTVMELVQRLLSQFEGRNFRVFMDRRYSSPELFHKLMEKQFFPVGTVMKSRKNLPHVFDDKKLKTGEVINRRKGQLLAIKWKDKRDVFMLSTMDKAAMVETEAGRGGHQKIKPAAVRRYNANKAGVDRHDQMASYYPLHRKTVKWWKKMFFSLFMMGVINVHKYMNFKNGQSTRLETFIKELAKELAAVNNESMPRPPTAANEPIRHKSGDHFPIRIPPTERKQRPTQRCIKCGSKRDANGKRIRKESSWMCRECDVPLCVECFYSYHRPHAR